MTRLLLPAEYIVHVLLGRELTAICGGDVRGFHACLRPPGHDHENAEEVGLLLTLCRRYVVCDSFMVRYSDFDVRFQRSRV